MCATLGTRALSIVKNAFSEDEGFKNVVIRSSSLPRAFLTPCYCAVICVEGALPKCEG